MNELSTVLLTIISSVTPLLGGGWFLFHKQNKRLKESEAKLAEVNVSKAEAEAKAAEKLAKAQADKADAEAKAENWNIIKSQLSAMKEQLDAMKEFNNTLIERNKDLVRINAEKEDRHQEDIKDWEDRFTNQTTVLRGVQRDLIAANEKMITKEQYISTLRLYINWLLDWHCEREEGEKKDDCNRRKPKQKVKLHYEPPTGIDSLLAQRNDANPTFINETNKECK